MFEFMNIVMHNHEEFVVLLKCRVVSIYHVTFVHVLSKCLYSLLRIPELNVIKQKKSVQHYTSKMINIFVIRFCAENESIILLC